MVSCMDMGGLVDRWIGGWLVGWLDIWIRLDGQMDDQFGCIYVGQKEEWMDKGWVR